MIKMGNLIELTNTHRLLYSPRLGDVISGCNDQIGSDIEGDDVGNAGPITTHAGEEALPTGGHHTRNAARAIDITWLRFLPGCSNYKYNSIVS